MRIAILSRRVAVSVAAAATLIVCVLTTESSADPQVYCDSYSRDAASRKTGQADLVTGTIGGSTGLIDQGEGDGAGAADRVADGSAAPDEKWRSAYEKSYAECMSNYEQQAAAEAAKAPPPQKAGKAPPPQKAVKAAKKAKASGAKRRSQKPSVRKARKASSASASRVQKPSKKRVTVSARRTKPSPQRTVQKPSPSGAPAAKAKATRDAGSQPITVKGLTLQRAPPSSPKCKTSVCRLKTQRPQS